MTFHFTDFGQTKQKVLNWAQQFNTFCFLDNHQYQIAPHTQECLLAAGCKRKISLDAGTALPQLQAFIDERPGTWLFGHLGYDLKNELETLVSVHPDGIGFPDLFFFEPVILIRFSGNEMRIDAANPAEIFQAILEQDTVVPGSHALQQGLIKSRMEEKEYLQLISRLQQHILRGDCYEINFCQEFYSEKTVIDPLETYTRLSSLSPNPFSAFYRLEDKWLICASPERFLQKQGNHILSQPIKGTAGRIPGDKSQDEQNKSQLFQSSKDRSENVMIVDLVRNDLARVCREGTVKVDELYGIYSFPQVHQMISTVSGELQEDCSFTRVIKACFPMGSMTGAPKKIVMELIEKYELSRRGIFSGALGYISPSGDFDFNVVIRSVLYNASRQYLSFPTGSAITFYSDPQKEWEECQLKAVAIKKVLVG